MKKIYYILLLAVVACMSLVSCDCDDAEKTPLDTPAITAGETKVSSLAFSWQAVNGATQYAYELYDASDNLVLGDVTTTTSVIATGLNPNSTYTLKVWAYAAVTGDKTTSPIATITSTTDPTIQLGSPVPEASSANGGITISWPAVEHATSYLYSYEDADGETIEGETETNSVILTNLAIGEYTITITATSEDETYTNSEPISLTFQRTKAEIWRKTGTYTSAALNESFSADIVAYDDGSYAIETPYGEKGYEIGFTVPEGKTEISPLATGSGGYYSFWVNSQYYVSIYTSNECSQFEGDKKQGEVWFWTYLYDANGNIIDNNGGYDDFTWGGESSSITIDDICGTYDAEVSCYDYFNWTSWSPISRTDEVTISDNGDGTVKIYNFYNWADDFIGKVDLEARTITVEPCTWSSYYTFADAEDETKAVIATINEDNSITFSNFGCWYDNSSYIYTGSNCIMTKK